MKYIDLAASKARPSCETRGITLREMKVPPLAAAVVAFVTSNRRPLLLLVPHDSSAVR